MDASPPIPLPCNTLHDSLAISDPVIEDVTSDSPLTCDHDQSTVPQSPYATATLPYHDNFIDIQPLSPVDDILPSTGSSSPISSPLNSDSSLHVLHNEIQFSRKFNLL